MDVLTKQEITDRFRAMLANRRRGYPIVFFCEFAGVHVRNCKKMCIEMSIPMTELSQRKLSKAFLALEQGKAGLRFDITGKKFIGWHPKEEQKPSFRRGITLMPSESGFQLKIAPVNRFSYQKTPLLSPKERK